jgi:cobalt-zinc-cadmium resistance protein CzcA
MFRPMALVVLFALGSAFVLSLTVIPALASLLLSRDASDHPSLLMRGAAAAYRPALRGALAWPRVTAAAAALALAASLWVGSGMGREFLPKLDEGSVVVTMVRLPSVSLDQSLEQTRQVEVILRRFPEVTSVVCRTGRAEIAVDPMGMNMTDVYVLLKPREQWTTASSREELIKVFDRALLAGVPGAGFAYTQPIEMNTSDLLAGISSDLALHIYGNDLTALRQLSERAAALLRAVPGAQDVRSEQIAGSQVMIVEVDRVAAGRLGVDAEQALQSVAAIGGVEVGSVVQGVHRYPIQVRLEGRALDIEGVASLPVQAREGVVPLGQLARISLQPGPSQINRERLARRVTVELNVRGRDIASYVQEAKVALGRGLRLPTGYSTAWAGEYERLESATLRLMIVVPITLALILVLLIATFGRLRPALVIFLNVPVAVTGGIFALSLRGMPLSISAAVGFIALFGVAVLNGLVLVAAVERRLDGSTAVDEVVRSVAEERLRPVLTTALVASLGFLPMALATGAGAEVQRPLATVVIGGIFSSTLLTLLVLPVVLRAVTRLPAPPREDPAPSAPDVDALDPGSDAGQ